MKYLKYSLIIAVLLGGGCKHFEPQALDDSQQLAVEEGEQKGPPATSMFKNGMIDDFSGDISPWWGGDGLTLVKSGDSMRVIAKGIGSKYTPFGRQFPAVDLSETPVVKVRVRYEGQLAPDLRIDLKDIYGMVANFNPPKFRLRKGGQREYYYNFEGKWKQSWPDVKPVDPHAISEMMFFINPGTADWTGNLFIDEIQFIKVSDIPSKKPVTAVEPATTTPAQTTTTTTVPSDSVTTTSKAVETNPINTTDIEVVKSADQVIIDDFSQEIKGWWTSNANKIKLSKEPEMMKVEFKSAGPAFETFGRSFTPVNFTKTPVVKIRVKAQGEQPVMLRVDIKDASGFSTNARPIAIKLENGTDFVDYYYDFTDKFEQSFPNVQKVNPESIIEILLFANPGGQPYTGTLFIDEIKVISLQDFKDKK